MMSSAYPFRLFISSAVYNLIDLRAELTSHLVSRGYQPVLSSEVGFPDRDELEPWESCLDVLAQCFITIVIIDSRYGQQFEWKAFPAIGARKISPTHAEFLYARHLRKRVFVFIRRGLMPYYQQYRRALKLDKKGAAHQDALRSLLPDNTDFEVLEFIREVKTSRPIVWISEFDTVTDLKQQVDSKLQNDLAEVFLFRERQQETVIQAFAQLVDTLPESAERRAILEKAGLGETLRIIESQDAEIARVKRERDEFAEKAEDAKLQLKSAQEEGNTRQASKLEAHLAKTIQERDKLKTELAELEAQKLVSSLLPPPPPPSGHPQTFFNRSVGQYNIGDIVSSALGNSGGRCDSCESQILVGSSRTCSRCLRTLCSQCWPITNTQLLCPRCTSQLE